MFSVCVIICIIYKSLKFLHACKLQHIYHFESSESQPINWTIEYESQQVSKSEG